MQNYIIESSVSYCVNESNFGVIVLENGCCGIYSSNISKNTAYEVSGFELVDHNHDALVNFSTIENNTAYYVCIYHETADTNHKWFCCNCVHNIAAQVEVYLMSSANLIVENCSILGPYGHGYPFYSEMRITFINCNVDEGFYIRDAGNIKASIKNVVTINSLYSLKHLSTYECEAVYNLPIGIKQITTEIIVSEQSKIIVIMMYNLSLLNHS